MPEFNIDKLIDKPLNELTEEEAEFVIDWKVKRQMKEMEFQQHIQAIQNALNENLELHKKQTEHAQNTLDALVNNALDYYDKVSNNG